MTSVDWSWSQRYFSPILTPDPAPPLASNHDSYPDPRSTQTPSTSMASIPEHRTAQAPNFTAGGSTTHHALHSSTSLRSLRPSLTGRKRSRDEFSDADSDVNSISPFPSVAATPAGEPVLGPGMALVYPGGEASSARQQGVWTEELIEQFRTQSVAECHLPGKKAMRLGAAASGMEDVAVHADTPHEPAVDSATLTLGVSWCELPATPTMDAAARGWARYIEDYYPLQGVRIVWLYKAAPAYLVCASSCRVRGQPGVSGYYLFDENLTEGRLVAKSFERTLDLLRMVPFAFDGAVTLRAGEAADAADGMDLS